MRLQAHLARAAGILASVAVVGFQMAVVEPASAVIARTSGGHLVSYQPTRSQVTHARNLARTRIHASASKRAPRGSAGVYKECGGTGACLSYYGGPIMGATTVTPVFWNPTGLSLSYPSEYKGEIEQFITGVAADSGKETNFFSLLTQYYELVGGNTNFVKYSVTAGAPINDTDALPSAGGDHCTTPFLGSGRPCVTDLGVRTELESVIESNHLEHGLGHEYIVFFPPGIDSCFDAGGTNDPNCSGTGYCGYHGSLSPTTEKEAEYANEPDNADPEYGTGCLPTSGLKHGYATTDSTSHEISESVTDPYVATLIAGKEVLSWYDEEELEVEPGFEIEYGEIGDMCAYEFKQGDPALIAFSEEGFNDVPLSKSNQTIAGHPYLLQLEWDNAHSTCSLSEQAASTKASFTNSDTAGTLTGEAISFDGSASHAPSDPHVPASIGTYEWSWGDGTHSSGSSPLASHAYATTGGAPASSFEVTLTVTDTNNNTATTTQTVHVGDRAPSAAFSPLAGGTAGIATQFDGSPSSDPDGGVAGYSWSFGDGASGSGAQAAHVYTKAGSYQVKLTVTDAAGLTASTEQTVVVAAPSNFVRIVKSKNNKKTGAVTLTIAVPGAGTLGARDASSARHSDLLVAFTRAFAATAKGKGKKAPVILVKPAHSNMAGAGTIALTIAPTSAGLAKLHSKRTLPVKMLLEFTPTDGTLGTTPTTIRLVLQPKKGRK